MFQEALAREFAPYRELSPVQLDALEKHYQLMLRWNGRLNLTRVTAVENAVQLHYCESLLLGLHLPSGPLTVADVGSGAGFPGIPIAILRPETSMTLIESDQRKAVFLREASRGLSNVSVAGTRADAVSGSCDWIVSRAVAYQDLFPLKFASNFALLIGENHAVELNASRVIRVPWGDHRVIAIVPRETFGDRATI